MGRRGPPPTPSHVLRLRGSWRGDLNRNEPTLEPGRPRCPTWLATEAKAAWKQLVPQLEQIGILTRIDGHALAVLCQTWARWRKAEQFIQDHGETYPVKHTDGTVRYLKKFPQVTIAESSARTLSRFMQEFGLTPSARTRIRVEQGQDQEASDKRRYLNLG